MDKILALIPARGGSKGVPRKNIRLVNDKPLIAYTIDAALTAREVFCRVIVSTDDEEIATISREYGAEVPFMRPAELAGDKARSLPVIQHAIKWVEQSDRVHLDWVMLLQPTAPMRTAEDIRAAVALTHSTDDLCDSVISVMRVYAHHPILMKRIENNQLLPFCMEEIEGTRRQDYQPPAYMRNGAIYLTRRNVLMNRDSIWGEIIRPYEMPAERSLNVDDELDLALVDLVLRKQSI
ncbi:MAG: acylneuraminate cytidylyltransferase family protein [Anaerolineae bacterium]|nr:acylneuraminate cytidylyltransferase family protein [Anaerolineae bacterium]NUQ06970.1 acylneuraminate cytidylyltransferase family protein [Anaerolineae bacterium]